jgi:hypothetical protein
VDHRVYDGLRPLTETREPRNPFRNEADAFRILVIVGAGAAVVIVAATVFGTTAGALLGLTLLLLGGYFALRWLRVQLEAPPNDEKR